MRTPLALLCAALLTISLHAQERLDQDVFWRIRQEATLNSRVLNTIQVLTDVHAPRLTGSPNLRAAGEWAIGQMQGWGLANGHLEPFDFGRVGWVNEKLSVHITAPVKDSLVGEATGWTPGTDGVVRAAAVQVKETPPQNPTQSELNAYFERIRPLVQGRIVLIGGPGRFPINFNPAEMRLDESTLQQRFSAPPARAGGPGGGGRGNADGPPRLSAQAVAIQFNEFLLKAGTRVRVNDANMALGLIRAFNTASYDPTRAPSAIYLRNEDYGRIWRLLESNRGVELEIEMVNRVYPEGRTAHNAVAEIPGTDKADEVVMLGGHLDSWHAGTGATDNAAGVAVVMEAARILKAIGARPRRTIRVALWGGEEQGLLGSQAYVREHFGFVEEPKPEHAKLAGYVNIDSGTGAVRGMTAFGPPSAAGVLRDVLASFRDLGVVGATTTATRNRGGSDHTSFNEAGLPGINVTQDPVQYFSNTWHTQLDTYERISEDDLKKAAIVIASAVYHLAMRDELLPRFAPADMPARPAGRGGGGSN
jgi:carboxypeptidase Q